MKTSAAANTNLIKKLPKSNSFLAIFVFSPVLSIKRARLPSIGADEFKAHYTQLFWLVATLLLICAVIIAGAFQMALA